MSRADYHGEEDEVSPAIGYLGTDADPKVQLEPALDALFAAETEKIKHLHVTSDQDFKTVVDLPLARIKRIMKSDEDVRMISAEAPVLFAKACELFIMELTMR
jgi:nuclear transcription factor Y, gamma